MQIKYQGKLYSNLRRCLKTMQKGDGGGGGWKEVGVSHWKKIRDDDLD